MGDVSFSARQTQDVRVAEFPLLPLFSTFYTKLKISLSVWRELSSPHGECPTDFPVYAQKWGAGEVLLLFFCT
jgi:hypothetical protein